MVTVEFFFDYTCPYAYLASTQIEALCARVGAELVLRPMLLGGLFRAVGTANNLNATLLPQKARVLLNDQRRWASLWEVDLAVPRPGGYARSVEALRATLVLQTEADRRRAMHAIYRAHWVDHRDIGELSVLANVLDGCGLDGAAVVAGIDDTAKRLLRENTDEAAARGAFGAPTMFVGSEMFYGQDRLGMLERALGGSPREPGEGRYVREGAAPDVSFYYDVSSPFAYLAGTQIEGLARARGARVLWRPIFLGGLFKSLEGPTAPFATFSANKQRFVTEDLTRCALALGAPYRWNTSFPVRSLKAQRIAVGLCPEGDQGSFARVSAWAQRVFRAVWAEDQDPEDDAVLARCLADVGEAPEVLALATDPACKQGLIVRTQEAMDAQIFGVPTFVIEGKAVWGQDRLSHVARMLEGWAPPDMN
ncbi:MAG: 2-hydroxychromene-2-carboxylate isomerase [Deltaproteobacteria bacterium]|nr:2-hydroxychromene-2-carboxylate isomerase [Deltaproteobacteria bacterium]